MGICTLYQQKKLDKNNLLNKEKKNPYNFEFQIDHVVIENHRSGSVKYITNKI